MAKINLNDEEKKKLIEALNNETEPPPEFVIKLFPHLADKYDIKSLDRARVPTLEYAGKRSKAAILAEAGLYQGAPLQTVRCFGEAKEGEWQNMIVQGDNLQFLKTCYQNTDSLIKDKVKGKVKLIYIDPPFAIKSEFGGKDGERSYSDKVDTAEFIEGLRERLIYLREILADDGSIYLHLDQKMSHYVKIVLDEVFGKDRFNSMITWEYQGSWVEPGNNYPKRSQSIFFYSKTKNYVFHRIFEQEKTDKGVIARWEKYIVDGKIYGKYAPYDDGKFQPYLKDFIKQNKRDPQDDDIIAEFKGRAIGDVWYVSMLNPMGKEFTNYPTQKPEELIKRIILTSTNPDDLAMDCFAGSGTTAAVAEKLGRRWIMCDFGKHAIYTIQKRALRIRESEDLLTPKKEKKIYKKCDKCGRKVLCDTELKSSNKKYGKDPNPFCVVSAGAYDFSKVMELHKNKDAYINFVLGLFQLSRDDKAGNKYKLVNIYGEKDGNPVEVYPAWDDNFLVNIRVDEDYLKQIIEQSGNKLKGDYYIITPETCTNIGDTTLDNGSGGKVNFKMLTFPYKILEDVARNFQLEEQPSSQENVNQLITSTAFYFNEDVEFKVEKVKEGLKITKFETKILDKEGNRYDGLDGLAMVLVDVDYNGKMFDMEKTVFLKDIDKENNLIEVSGLTKNVAVIAIDKHGNESKAFRVK